MDRNCNKAKYRIATALLNPVELCRINHACGMQLCMPPGALAQAPPAGWASASAAAGGAGTAPWKAAGPR